MPSEPQSVTQLGYATRIPMRRSSHALIVLALAIATATLLVPGANDAAARTDVTPQSPIALLREMSEFLRKQQSLAFHSEVNFELYEDDQKLQFAGAVDVRIRRPNRLSIDYRDDLASRRVWYDGSKLTLLDPAQGVLASSDAPPVLDDALDEFAAEWMGGNRRPFVVARGRAPQPAMAAELCRVHPPVTVPSLRQRSNAGMHRHRRANNRSSSTGFRSRQSCRG